MRKYKKLRFHFYYQGSPGYEIQIYLYPTFGIAIEIHGYVFSFEFDLPPYSPELTDEEMEEEKNKLKQLTNKLIEGCEGIITEQ